MGMNTRLTSLLCTQKDSQFLRYVHCYSATSCGLSLGRLPIFHCLSCFLEFVRVIRRHRSHRIGPWRRGRCWDPGLCRRAAGTCRLPSLGHIIRPNWREDGQSSLRKDNSQRPTEYSRSACWATRLSPSPSSSSSKRGISTLSCYSADSCSVLAALQLRPWSQPCYQQW